jgi:hypothetical protein
VFPTQLRATRNGFAIGFGRAGAMLAPIVAGLLFRAGYGLQFVALAMGSGSLLAAAALWLLPPTAVEIIEMAPPQSMARTSCDAM